MASRKVFPEGSDFRFAERHIPNQGGFAMRVSKAFGVRQCAVLASAAVLMACVVFLYHGLVAGTIDHEICKTCHEKTYNEAMGKPFRPSVVDPKCGVCHVGGGKDSSASGGGAAISFSSSGFRREALFPLKGFSRDKNDYSVEGTAVNASGKGPRPAAVTFDGNTAPELMEAVSAFSINNIEVEEVKQGVFFEAVIFWKTDSFADSALEYITRAQDFKTISSS